MTTFRPYSVIQTDKNMLLHFNQCNINQTSFTLISRLKTNNVRALSLTRTVTEMYDMFNHPVMIQEN